MSVEFHLRPPPPPPPPASGPPPSSVPASKKKLYQTIASSRSPVEGDHTEARFLLSQWENRWNHSLCSTSNLNMWLKKQNKKKVC